MRVFLFLFDDQTNGKLWLGFRGIEISCVRQQRRFSWKCSRKSHKLTQQRIMRETKEKCEKFTKEDGCTVRAHSLRLWSTAHIKYKIDFAHKIILIYCTSGQCEPGNDARQDTNKKIIQNDSQLNPILPKSNQIELNWIESNRTEKDDIMSIRRIRSIFLPQGGWVGENYGCFVLMSCELCTDKECIEFMSSVCTWSSYTLPNIEWLLALSNFISRFYMCSFLWVQLSRLQC